MLNNLLSKLAKIRNSVESTMIIKTNSSISSFWDAAHSKNCSRWITGSLPKDELENLRFGEVKNRVQDILVVGVGAGHTANYLQRQGFTVKALDISEKAFRALNAEIECFLVDEYQLIPNERFDLVLHHLVAQHMSDSDLESQLSILFKSLRKGGEIRMQLASSMVDSRNDVESTFLDRKRGSVLRSQNQICALAEQLSQSYELKHLYDFPSWEEGWSWYLLIIRK